MDEAQEVFQGTFETVHFLENRVNDNTLKYIGIAAGVFLLFLFFRKIFTKHILGLLLKLTRKAKEK